jgi:uncharacterized membrane protein YgcG
MKRFFIKGIISISVLLLITAGASAQKVSAYTCKWRPGLATDNEESLVNQMQFNEKSQFLFLISNDEKNLYVDLMVADRAALQKIMRYGLTTWFNTEAKTKKESGIEFPVSSEGMNEPAFMKDKGSNRKEMRTAMMAGKNEEMVLVGFSGNKDRKVIDPRVDTSFHGKVEMMEGGKLLVSLVVPLEKLDRGNVETAKSPVSVGFETGYMDLTRQGGMSSGGGQQSGGGGQHGGGGMYGGGMPGGGPPPAGGTANASGSADQQERPDISEMASPSKLWIKQVILASKPE